MSATDLSLFFSGGIVLGSVVIALFFLRFWYRTRERLFAWFALAFAILALERVLLVAGASEWAHQPRIYCTRLLAFLIIAWAIWDKNRKP